MKTPPRPIHLACALTLSLVGLLPAVQAETLPVAGGAVSTSLTGKVTVVNVEKRLLTLQTPEGRFEVLRVPPEVKRLNEIKIGNTLTITETELLLVDLQKGADVGEPGVSTESAIVRDSGKKPSGMMIDSVTVTGIVTALDKAKSSVTIQGSDEHVTLKVEDPSVLDSVAVGDGVSASYMRAISGEVTFQAVNNQPPALIIDAFHPWSRRPLGAFQPGALAGRLADSKTPAADSVHSVKLYASRGVSARTGNDYDLIGIAWQYRWGGGLSP